MHGYSFSCFFFFFFNDPATTEIYTLSLHDALPISLPRLLGPRRARRRAAAANLRPRVRGALRRCERTQKTRSRAPRRDRKSTRLNSSHANISYAVFCLKKKKK